jgi:pyrophosphatase PpaX
MSDACGLFWDVDGTLSNSSGLGLYCTNQIMKRNDLPEISEDDYNEGTKYTTPQRLAWHVTGDPTDEVGEKLGKQYDELYVSEVTEDNSKFFPGVKEMLSDIADRYGDKVKFGALSNACGAYVRKVLKINGVGDLYKVQVGAEDIPAAKPNPHGLHQMCGDLGLEESRCIYIGDSPTDGQAGKAAGMHCIGVAWGSHPVDKINEAFPVVVHEVGELKEEIIKFLEERMAST